MPIIVPLWFYQFGSLMYFIAAVIGGLLTYFSFKLYDVTRKRAHLFLCLSFLFITLGFIVLTASNAFTNEHFENCNPDCVITRQEIFNWIVLGNNIYYLTSIIGYSLFLLSYPIFQKKDSRKLRAYFAIFPAFALTLFFQQQPVPPSPPGFFLPQPLYVLYPFESMFFSIFHLVSVVLMALIVLKTLSNYMKNKSFMTALLPVGFAGILVYHLLMFSLPFSPLFFAFAHLSLLAGFAVLLLMLVKVTKK